MSLPVRRAHLLLLFLPIAVLGCGTSESNYQSAAEKVIEGDIAEQAGLGDLEASCTKPESTAVGDTFSCTGDTSDGAVIEFVATVETDNKVNVESTNLIAAGVVDQIEEIAVGVLEQDQGQTLGRDNFDCGDTSVVIDVNTEVLACILTHPTSGQEYDATVDIPSLEDVGNLTVEVSDTPRA